MYLLYISLILIIIYYLSKEKKTGKIITKKIGIRYILNDKDNYFKSFSVKDLQVRNVATTNEYKLIGIRSIVDGNTTHEKIINKVCKIVDHKLKCINEKWFDYAKCKRIPWKFCLFIGYDYEEGLPHTRQDIIFINEKDIKFDRKLINTIIHERIHIYQKRYPSSLTIYLDEKNMSKYKVRKETDKIRANPDINEWIYKDVKGNKMKAVYKKNASRISDVTYYPYNTQYNEHPLEQMAIYAVKKIQECRN